MLIGRIQGEKSESTVVGSKNNQTIGLFTTHPSTTPLMVAKRKVWGEWRVQYEQHHSSEVVKYLTKRHTLFVPNFPNPNLRPNTPHCPLYLFFLNSFPLLILSFLLENSSIMIYALFTEPSATYPISPVAWKRVQKLNYFWLIQHQDGRIIFCIFIKTIFCSTSAD